MAGFKAELPNDLIKEFENLDLKTDDMFSEMVDAGVEVVYKNVQMNMSKSFKTTKSLQKGLHKTKSKKLRKNDGYGGWVGFSGYTEDGTPIPLIALAREYGTSRGESKRPFLRKSVNKSEIESAMTSVQAKYLPKG